MAELGLLVLREVAAAASSAMTASRTPSELILAISEVDQLMSNARDGFKFVDMENSDNVKITIVEKTNIIIYAMIQLMNKVISMNRLKILEGMQVARIVSLIEMLIKKMTRVVREMKSFVHKSDLKALPHYPQFENLEIKVREFDEYFSGTQLCVDGEMLGIEEIKQLEDAGGFLQMLRSQPELLWSTPAPDFDSLDQTHGGGRRY